MVSTLKLFIPDVCGKFRLLERAKVVSLKIRFSFQTAEGGRNVKGQLRELSGLPNMGGKYLCMSFSIPQRELCVKMNSVLENTTYEEAVKDLVIFVFKK